MEKIVLKIKLFILFISCIGLTSCLKEDDLKLPFLTYVPANLSDGWEISSPSHEGIDEMALHEIYKYYHENSNLWQVRSLLVFRNNKLIAESYTKNPHEITQPVPVWSCTKQVLAILTGIAVEQGYIDNVNNTIQKYLPAEVSHYPDKENISIENLLKMESGISFSNDGFNGETNKLLREIPSNSLDFILGLSTFCKQGEQFNYNDGDPHIISAILQHQTKKTTKDWAKEVLFSKLGIENFDWITYKDGITMGAFGISTTPREMAKIGHLILNKGIWNGQRIVSSAWIDEMVSTKVSADKVNYYGKTFGYYWWIDESRGIVFMYGKGGQFVFIKPSKNLVMVTTADPNDDNIFSVDTALDVFDRIDSVTD